MARGNEVLMRLELRIAGFQNSLNKATAAMRNSGNSMARSAKQGTAAMGKSTKQAGKLAGAMKFLQTRVIGAGLFFAAFYQGLITFRQLIGDAVAELFDLDDALRAVQSITKQSDSSIGRLRNSLLDLAKVGALFDQSAASVAESMFTIVQAGFTASEALTLARLAAEGAAVGFTTAEVSAQVLVGVLKAYDRPVSEARDVMDTLFQTVDTGIITFNDLATGLGKVLASANSLDVPLEEVTAAIATMTLRGFTADQAMTSLGRILQTFIRPSMRAAKAAKAVGIELSKDILAANGFVGTLEMMFAATGGNVNQFAKLFDRIQSTRGAISLFSDDGALLNEVLLEMGVATLGVGAMQLALDERSKSLKFQLGKLRSQMLAVTTDALEPMMNRLAELVGGMRNVLAGGNPVINFLADLKSIVSAVTITFLFMQRAAISAMFTRMAASLAGLVTTMRLVAMGTLTFSQAMSSLGAALGKVAPILVFMAVFTLTKYAREMKNADIATQKMGEATEQFRKKLAELEDLGLPEDVLEIRKFELAKDDLSDLLGELVVDFNQAAQDTQTVAGKFFGEGFDEGVDRLLRSIGSLGQETGSELQKIRDNVKDMTESWIDDTGLAGDALFDLSRNFFRLGMASEEGSKTEELFRIVAETLGEASSEAKKMDRFITEAKAEAAKLEKKMGLNVDHSAAMSESIDKWIKPIKEAKDLLTDILGLVSKEQIILDAELAPVMTRIAESEQQILNIDGAILARKTELAAAGADISDIEDGIIDNLEGQKETLELQIELDENIIAKAEGILEIEALIDDELVKQLKAMDLQEGKLPVLESLTNEQQRTLGQIVKMLNEDIDPAMGDWITQAEEQGLVLEDEVLDALLEIVDNMEGNQLSIDVTAAMTALGVVKSDIGALRRMLEVGALGVDAFLFGAGILQSQAPTQRHGVRNFIGGLTMVGEAGQELVRLPRGSDVIPNHMVPSTLRAENRQGPQRLEDVEGTKGRQVVVYVNQVVVEGDPTEALEALGLQALASRGS